MFGKTTLFRFTRIYTFRETYSVGSMFPHKGQRAFKFRISSGHQERAGSVLSLDNAHVVPHKVRLPSNRRAKWKMVNLHLGNNRKSLAVFHGYLAISNCAAKLEVELYVLPPNWRSLFTSVHKVTSKRLWLICINDISLHRLLCLLGLLRANAEDRLVIGQHCRLPGNCKSWAARHTETRKNRS